MRIGIEHALDAIMPRKARTMRTATYGIDDFSLSPASHNLLTQEIVTLMDYQHISVRDLIHSLKYDRSDHAAHLAALVLADYLREEIASHKAYSQKPVHLIPIPLHQSRARERGFNQIERILARLPQEFKDGTLSTITPETLLRTRATSSQTKLSRHERLSNVAGAFAVPHTEHVRGALVFLIDDVVTTGATLVNASTPLKRAGASVTLLALARA